MIRIVSFFCFLLILGAKGTSQCNAATIFSSIDTSSLSPLLPDSKCVEIDLSESVRHNNKQFEYEWELNDGITKRGVVIEHCFPAHQLYAVRLSVIDPQNELIVFRNELELPIDLRSDTLKIELPDTLILGTTLQPTITTNSELNGFQYYWSFNNKEFSCEKKPSFSIQDTDSYTISLIVSTITSGQKAHAFVGKKGGVISRDLKEHFISKFKKEPLSANRFVKDEIHFSLFNEQTKEHQTVNDVYKNDILLLPDTGQTYTIVAWSGNRFTSPVKFNTISCSSPVQALRKMDQAILKMLTTPLNKLSPIYFNEESLEINPLYQKAFNENAALLKNFESLSIKIGTYTHANSPYASAIEEAEKREGIISELLISKGALPKQLTKADLHKDRILINRCKSYNDCHLEDNALNERTEFKIIGFLQL